MFNFVFLEALFILSFKPLRWYWSFLIKNKLTSVVVSSKVKRIIRPESLNVFSANDHRIVFSLMWNSLVQQDHTRYSICQQNTNIQIFV